MLKDFLHQARRVLKVARKPDQDEFFNVAKITGLGIVIIGVIGFLIRLIINLIEGTPA